MAIVAMKRLRLIGYHAEKDALVRRLLDFGAAQLMEKPELDEEMSALFGKPETAFIAERDVLMRLGQALDALNKYVPEKLGLLPEKELLDEAKLFGDDVIVPAKELAALVLGKEEKISRAYTQISQLEAQQTALLPWQKLDVDLATEGTAQTAVLFGTVSSKLDVTALEAEFARDAGEAALYVVGESKESYHLMVVCHRLSRESVVSVLRQFGFSQTVFTEKGTPEEQIQAVSQQIADIEAEKTTLIGQMQELAAKRSVLKLGFDRVSQELAQESAKEKLLTTGTVFSMEAWFEAPKEAELGVILSAFSCAYETSDPVEEEYENVPVKLKGNALTNPLNMVTEMYGLPAYNGIDPNGLIMPFFTLFFGIMYADLGYGIILVILASILRRKRLSRGMKNAMNLLLQVGVTTAIFGALFGGFFGDVIPVFSETFLSQRHDVWALIDPLNDPTVIMVGALILGGIQIVVGMIVNAYMSFRDGKPLDGILDVVPWWVLFGGIALAVLGHGIWLMIVGAVAIVLTQGRQKKSIPGKLFSGLGKLYDITAYFGDVLSYIRLMALLLVTGIIGSVFNLFASMAGSGGGVLGFLGFALVFLGGHAFNLGFNIIGTFVHAARLQFLEFFGKFYKDGGRAFDPLTVKTKYYDIKK